MITWVQEMETGIETIDEQHRKLIGKINELETAILENRGRAETQKILEFVLFYADWHFKQEESCMHYYQCPAAEQNKEQHEYFLKRFSSLHYQYYQTNADPEIVQATLNELMSWTQHHILHVDTELKTYVPEQDTEKTSLEQQHLA